MERKLQEKKRVGGVEVAIYLLKYNPLDGMDTKNFEHYEVWWFKDEGPYMYPFAVTKESGKGGEDIYKWMIRKIKEKVRK